MDEEYKRALSEIFEILSHSCETITDKIPEKFMNFILDNMDKDYRCSIDFNDENWEDTVKKETLSIMALIYRDYICSKEEREQLIQEELAEAKKKEKEAQEEYSIETIFKNKQTQSTKDREEDVYLIKIEKLPWYKRVLKKLGIIKDK